MDELNEFIDFVAAGQKLIKGRDTNAWALGDLCVDFEFKVGRPSADDPDVPTLSDLAHEWNVDSPRVSEWRSVAKFYPPNLRLYEDLSWTHYNLARRASKGDLELAMDYLEVANSALMGIQTFRRHIAGILYEGEILTELLPEHLRMFAHDAPTVWLVIKRKAEDE